MHSVHSALQILLVLIVFSLVSAATVCAAGYAVGSPARFQIVSDTPAAVMTATLPSIALGIGENPVDAMFIKRSKSNDFDPIWDTTPRVGPAFALLNPVDVKEMSQANTNPVYWRGMGAAQPASAPGGESGSGPLTSFRQSHPGRTRIIGTDTLTGSIVEKNPVVSATSGRITILPVSPLPSSTVAPDGDLIVLQVSPVNYYPGMSSTPGMKLTVRCPGTISGQSCTVRWKCTAGYFILWNPPDFQVHEIGSETSPVSGPVYWTYRPGETPFPCTVRVTAASNSGSAASLLIMLDEDGYATAAAITG